MVVTLAQWAARDDLRADWAAFMKSEAFELGVTLLEGLADLRAVPLPTDTMEQKAAKLDALDGARKSIKELRSLAGDRTGRRGPIDDNPGWGHIKVKPPVQS